MAHEEAQVKSPGERKKEADKITVRRTLYAAGAGLLPFPIKVFTQHFDQGGTLLSFDPVASRKYFQQEFEAGRLVVKEAAHVAGSKKYGFFSRLSGSKKREQERRERDEIIGTNKALTEAIAGLREEIAALKE